MPSVLSRGYFHRRLSERWMLMCLPKSSYTRVSAMSLPRNTPTQSGIQRRVMSIRLYHPSQFLSSHRPICAGHQSLHLPVLRPRGDEFVTVTRLEHIIRPLCSFRLHSPLICVVSKKRASLASSESAKKTLEAGPPASRMFSALASFCFVVSSFSTSP